MKLGRHPKTFRAQGPLTPWEKAQKKRAKKVRKQREIPLFKKLRRKMPKTNNVRKRRLHKNATILVTFFVVIAVLAFYFCLPISRANKIQVRHANSYVQAKVIRASGITSGESFFLVRLHQRAIEQKIKTDVRAVQHVSLNYQAGKVVLDVKTHQPVGYLSDGDTYRVIADNGGILSQPLTDTKDNIPVFFNFKQATQLHATAQQIAQLPPRIRNAISEIHYAPTKTSTMRLHLYMNDGNQVLILIPDVSQKMKYYPGIASKLKEKSMIDLQVGAYSYALK